MNIYELAQRHQDDYDGYVLTNWYEAAFPFLEIQLTVLLQNEQPLPLVDQFILRSIEIGLEDVNDITGILGVEHTIVHRSLDHLNRSGCLLIVSIAGTHCERITLTNKGRSVLQTLRFMQPSEEMLTICRDAITGEYQKHRSLQTYRNVKDQGIFQIPRWHVAVPSVEQLDTTNIRNIWKEMQHELPSFQREKNQLEKNLVSILSIDKSYSSYYIMRVLQYIRKSDGDVQIQVYDNAILSRKHEEALIRMHREGVNVLRGEPRQEWQETPDSISTFVSSKVSHESLEDAHRRNETRSQLYRERVKYEEQISVGNVDPTLYGQAEVEQSPSSDVDMSRLNQRIRELEDELEKLSSAGSEVQILPMVEHRPRLLEALKRSQEQLVIISPWLKTWAVNKELTDGMEKALRRGVEIIVGYGFDRESDEEEKRSLRQLKELAKRLKTQKFKLYRLQDVHAKVIMWDQTKVIISSFNWLSFAGRSDWGTRVEYGTFIHKPDLVYEFWNTQLQPLLEKSQVIN